MRRRWVWIGVAATALTILSVGVAAAAWQGITQVSPETRALHEALRAGKSHDVLRLLKAGANPYDFIGDKDAVYMAVEFKRRAELRDVLTQSRYGNDPELAIRAIKCCLYFDYEVGLQDTLRGQNLRSFKISETTPVGTAAKYGALKCIPVLIDNGFPIDERDKEGRTAMCLAALGGSKIIRDLAKRGLAVNVKDNAGRSPLHYAANKGDAEALRTLLELKADPHALDNRARTAIFYARNIKSAEALLRVKARLDIVDRDGFTPRKLFERIGQKDMAKFLEQKEGKVSSGR